MSSTASELTVKLDSSEEDVFLVTYERPDGSVFRGALLKIKQWVCPNVRPTHTQSPCEEKANPSEDDCSQAGAAGGGGLSVVTQTADFFNGHSPELHPVKDETATMTDFAALQYRWSYFQKNAPPLPKRNLPSRKEKEKIEQVTKLRPRNFLCARCKYALPGFTQPPPPLSATAESEVPVQTQTAPSVGSSATEPARVDNTCVIPSHNRKRQYPLKRTAARPLAETCLVQEDFSVEEDATLDVDVHSKMALLMAQKKPASLKRPRLYLDVQEEPTAAATILSSPSGESLKMKFKLSQSPVNNDAVVQIAAKLEKPASKRPRRAKAAMKVNIREVVQEQEEDEDDFELQPRLRIDDDVVSPLSTEPISDPIEVVLTESKAQFVTNETPPRKKRVPRTGKVNQLPVQETAPVPVTLSTLEEEKMHPSAVVDCGGGLLKPVARAVKRCQTKDGRNFAVGDVVWGKILGYPWWPGFIQHIVVCDDPMLQKSASTPAFADPNQPPLLQYQEAQIEWYGQKASISYIEVNQLAHFAQDYQKKYKPKLRTASYQDAVKLATQALTRAPGDASLVEEDEEEQDVLSEIISESRERQKTLNNQIIQNDVYHFPPLEDTRRPTSAS